MTDRDRTPVPTTSSDAIAPSPLAAPHRRLRGIDDRWADWFAGGMLVLAVVVAIISLVPSWHGYFARDGDIISILIVPVVPSLVYAAVCAVMSAALRRRLRAAWWVLVLWWFALPTAGRLWSLSDGQSAGTATLLVIGTIVGITLTVLAVLARAQFQARRVPGSLWAALAIFLVGGAVMLFGGAWLVARTSDVEDNATALLYVFNQMASDLGRGNPASELDVPWWVRLVIGVCGAAVVIGAALVLFRPRRTTVSVSVPDEARVRTLLRDFGDGDSLGYFATRRDKAVVWDTGDARTARAGISYRTVGSVSLASGDPIGDPHFWPDAIERWRTQARNDGLSIAVMAAGTAGGETYSRAGLVLLELGDEAILDLGGFSLTAPGMKAVRQSVARLHHHGYTAQVARHSSLGPADFDRLDAAAAAWRGDGGDERGFSMALGRLGDPLDGDCVLVTAHDADGALRGFLSFVPWGRTGLSLDLMRRDPTAENGLVEFLVASLAAEAARHGFGRVSLNFAMFREAFERGAELGAGPIARLWRQGLLFASRRWQLESLYRSNAKYLPDWQPRFLGYEYASDLPRVGTAAGNAEGFLQSPSLSLFRAKANPEETLSADGASHADAVRALIPAPPDLVAEAVSADRFPEQVRVRRAKLDRLRAAGIDPYPVGAPRTHMLAEVRAAAGPLEPDTETDLVVAVTGRVMLKRELGGLSFATLRDGSGDLQVMIEADHVGPQTFDLWTHGIDLGDHVAVGGQVITTRRGELSVRATEVMLTSKALRPLPEKHKGLTDPDTRIRKRYVDLIVRPEARTIAYQRAAVVRSIRDSLQARAFVEVETPVLQTIHGGANARPFETHINAYDLDLYLRIATELHLKRLIVGGMERVFEVGRQFRNEGVDFKHNPEFTSLEVYETYGDYDTMRVLTQQMIQEAAIAVHGSPVARRPNAEGKVEEYDLSGDWPVKTVCAAVSEKLGEEITADTPVEVLVGIAGRIGLELDREPTWGYVLEEIYGELCEGSTTTPVFYTDFPKENAPLTRKHRDDPRLAEKWDLVIFGSEQGTAYSELIDPVDQRERLVAQSLLAAAGDAEAMQVDEDFLEAIEHGMPPTGGMGLGVDRLVMNLTGLSIRDTILFPIVKPR